MTAERDRPPNLLAAAILAGVLGIVMLVLSLAARHQGAAVGIDAWLLIALLFAGSVAAFGRHKALEAMTPEERGRYWARKDAEWRATADAHARSMLGRDYDKK